MTVGRAGDGMGYLRVRPYALTGGRTRAATELPIEAILVQTPTGHQMQGRMTLEKGQLLRMCVNPMSVAEVSAHLSLPLGVARVLAGDLVTDGLLDFNRTTASGERPDHQLLERVFDGLQAL